MSDSSWGAGHYAVLAAWIFSILSFFAFGGILSTIGQGVFYFMAVAHVIEVGVFWKGLQASGKPMGGQIVQTLIFGVVHYQTVKQDAPAG